jgi:hypothetical protein
VDTDTRGELDTSEKNKQFVMILMRLVWAVHEANMGQIRTTCSISVGKHKGKKHVEHLVINGKITLKWIIKKGVKVQIGFTWLMLGSSGKLL